MHRVQAAFAGVVLSLVLPVWAGVSDEESRIVDSVKRHHDENVDLLERLVNVNSGTLNLAGVRENADLLRPQFEALGFSVRWIPMAEVGRAGHLVAERQGGGKAGKRILMIAHLDTVFEADSPFQRFVRKGEIGEGPGTNDIKGGVVVILAALRGLADAGVLDRTRITVFLTGDEEKPGLPISATRRDLIAAGKSHDLALDFEAMVRKDGKDTIHIARRGDVGWQLSVSGATGHSSGVGREGGFGAVYELARIVDAFRRELPEENLTFNASLVAGGVTAQMNPNETAASATGKGNIIAAQAVAAGDLRTLSDQQTQRVQQKMRDIVARHLDRTSAEISFSGDGYPAMAPSAASKALFDTLNQANTDLGLAPLQVGDPLDRGAGDISFVAHDLPGLVGMGVAGEGTHAVGEYAELASIDTQATRAAILVARLSPR
jgi:glutamate carboxypeptidase